MMKGWELKRFEDLIKDSQIGLVRNAKEQHNDFRYRYLKMNSITLDNSLFEEKYAFVDASDEEVKKYALDDGDFLFNTRNSYELVGKTCVYEPKSNEITLFNNNILRVKFKKEFSSKFINYSFCTELIKQRLQKLKSGTTSVVGIYYNGLKNLEIPLPPLPEQQRIVAILDEAFAVIAKAKANAEQNLQNSKALFESYLQGVFENKCEGWEDVRFEDLCKLTRGHNPPKSKFISQPKDGYVRFYQIRDGWSDGYAVYVPDTSQLHKVTPDEILMVAYRHIGRVFKGVSGAFNVALCKISNRDRKRLDNDFLFYIIPTPVVRGELMKRSERSLIPSMSVEHLKEILIPLPPLKEQKKIVRQLDALRAQTQKLETIYQNKIAALEELKKSILQKAFSGELVTEKEIAI